MFSRAEKCGLSYNTETTFLLAAVRSPKPFLFRHAWRGMLPRACQPLLNGPAYPEIHITACITLGQREVPMREDTLFMRGARVIRAPLVCLRIQNRAAFNRLICQSQFRTDRNRPLSP